MFRRAAVAVFANAALLIVAVAGLGAQTAPGRLQPPPPPIWAVQAELSLVSATGNSDAQTLGLGGEVRHRPDGRDELVRVNFVRSSDTSGLTAESLSGVARASERLTTRTEAFAEFGYLRNRFAGIVDRYSIDGGLSYRLLAPPGAHDLRVFAGMGYLRESHANTPLRSAPAANGGFRYQWRFGDRGEIVDELRLTDTLAQGHDWRAAQSLSVTAGLNSSLSLKLSQRIEYVHDPVPGFRPTDILTSAALVLKF